MNLDINELDMRIKTVDGSTALMISIDRNYI